MQYDDGLVPDGSTITDFDVNPGGASTVATSSLDASGQTGGSALQRYTPSTGTYGATYASDSTGGSYVLYGSDQSEHRVLAARYRADGSEQDILSYNTDTGQQVADMPVSTGSGYAVIGGRVDSQRHRGALLARRGSDGADLVVPVNTTTGAVGTPIEADNGSASSFYTMLDIDRSTGKVDLVGIAHRRLVRHQAQRIHQRRP